ncbi:exo-alpha-sialidase [Rufibacter tibetensis]|uniref:Six-hairpin glycosidase n=1 Tax=Rufibacter tibetensis TaxID=512763 RepID=A0A0P0CVI2_9BACT|nr:exo-alpha-sialidase [Rufibacter tibetensis]ALJ01628.1 six-hairpin glycosidase [Rufibacter tibetensis]
MFLKRASAVVLSVLSLASVQAQDTVRYAGNTLSNVDYHHGQLSPAVGVHNIQVMRANREHPGPETAQGWTYNHAPMLAYWRDNFYLSYLSDPVGEHIPPSQTFLQTSKDGYSWSKPDVLFPPYRIPDGTRKEGNPGVAKDLDAIMHQRMGFYVSKSNRLLALGYYGIALDAKDDPNDGKGIGRVVREILPGGKLGPIYFIRYNSSWDQKKSAYPFYTKSKNKGFVQACNELLANTLMMQQWVEEADRNDPLIALKGEYKAFSHYHLPDNRIVGLWKHALTSISKDGGKTWQYSPTRAPGFVNSNAKIWGQRTSDGRYATVYNPSEFRWPLAVSTSDDGLSYKDLLLVNGEITTMRYGGNYKSYGPQYVRGILPGNGTPPGGNMWVTYSMNKEDIWVSSIPVPVTGKAATPANEVFAAMPAGEELRLWNIYSPLWAPVQVEKMADGTKALALKDWDKFDYAKAERVVPASKRLTAEFEVIPAQNDKGSLQIEFQDGKGSPALRLIFDKDGSFKNKAGYRLSGMMPYEANQLYKVRVEVDVPKRMYHVFVNEKKVTTRIFFAPVASIERIMFRTGEVRRFPDADTPTDQGYDVPLAGERDQQAAFYIKSLKTLDHPVVATSAK